MHTMSRLSETLLLVWLPIPQTALRLSGVIKIMPLRGIIVASADNLNSQFSILNSQFSIFNSQFSIFNSQFSILNFLHLMIPIMQNTS